MSSADEYYAYVEQCIALASKCLHPGDKARLLQMAKAWRDLAKKLEANQNKNAAKDSHSSNPSRTNPEIGEPALKDARSPARRR
jgi:hypothetical protein